MIVVPSLHVGGTERQVVLLCQGLVSLDATWAHRLRVVVLARGGELEAELPSSVTLEGLGGKEGSGPVAAWRLRVLVRRTKPDAVYTLLAPANLVASIALLRQPQKLVWGHRSVKLSTGSSAARIAAARLLLRVGAHRADSAIANSEAAGAFLEAFAGLRGAVHIVPNAIDSTRYRPNPSARRAIRSQLGLEDDEAMVLSVGRLVDDKDHPTLFAAFKLLQQEIPRARLFLAGAGGESAVAERTALAIDLAIDASYRYLGGERDVAMLYNAADVVVQSSKNEGYSNVLVESLASETPTVSTDCGNAALVLPPGNLAKVGDPRGLAEAAVRALTLDVRVPSPGVTPEELASSTLSAIFGYNGSEGHTEVP